MHETTSSSNEANLSPHDASAAATVTPSSAEISSHDSTTLQPLASEAQSNDSVVSTGQSTNVDIAGITTSDLTSHVTTHEITTDKSTDVTSHRVNKDRTTESITTDSITQGITKGGTSLTELNLITDGVDSLSTVYDATTTVVETEEITNRFSDSSPFRSITTKSGDKPITTQTSLPDVNPPYTQSAEYKSSTASRENDLTTLDSITSDSVTQSTYVDLSTSKTEVFENTHNPMENTDGGKTTIRPGFNTSELVPGATNNRDSFSQSTTFSSDSPSRPLEGSTPVVQVQTITTGDTLTSVSQNGYSSLDAAVTEALGVTEDTLASSSAATTLGDLGTGTTEPGDATMVTGTDSLVHTAYVTGSSSDSKETQSYITGQETSSETATRPDMSTSHSSKLPNYVTSSPLDRSPGTTDSFNLTKGDGIASTDDENSMVTQSVSESSESQSSSATFPSTQSLSSFTTQFDETSPDHSETLNIDKTTSSISFLTGNPTIQGDSGASTNVSTSIMNTTPPITSSSLRDQKSTSPSVTDAATPASDQTSAFPTSVSTSTDLDFPESVSTSTSHPEQTDVPTSVQSAVEISTVIEDAINIQISTSSLFMTDDAVDAASDDTTAIFETSTQSSSFTSSSESVSLEYTPWDTVSRSEAMDSTAQVTLSSSRFDVTNEQTVSIAADTTIGTHAHGITSETSHITNPDFVTPTVHGDFSSVFVQSQFTNVDGYSSVSSQSDIVTNYIETTTESNSVDVISGSTVSYTDTKSVTTDSETNFDAAESVFSSRFTITDGVIETTEPFPNTLATSAPVEGSSVYSISIEQTETVTNEEIYQSSTLVLQTTTMVSGTTNESTPKET